MKVKVCGESVEKEEKEEKKYGEYEEYEIKSAARALVEAEEIKKDAKKMKYVKMCLKEKADSSKKAYMSIADMKAKYKQMEKEDNSEY